MREKSRSVGLWGEGVGGALAIVGLSPLVLVLFGEAIAALTLEAGFLSTPEGLHFYSAYRVGKFFELYSGERLFKAPLSACPYMPVYPLAFGLLQRLFGPTPIWGRALSFVSALWGAFMILRLVEGCGGGRKFGALGAMIWLSSPSVMDWGVACTEDVMGVSLEATALLFGLKGRGWAAGAFLLLAVLTRPTTALCGAAALPFMGREGRRATAVGLAGAVLVAGAMGILTGGGFFRHLGLLSLPLWGARQIAVLAASLRASPALGRWGAISPSMPGLWGLFALLALSWGISRRAPKWLKVYLLAGFSVGILTSQRLGASTDYFLHFVVACSVGSAIALAGLIKGGGLGRLAPGLVVLVGAWDASTWGGAYLSAFPPAWNEGARVVIKEAVRLLKEEGGPVVSVDPSIPVRAGRESLVNEPWTFSVMALYKGWDWEHFEEVASRAIAVVASAPGVPSQECYPPQWREFILRLRRGWRRVRIGPEGSPYEVEVLLRPLRVRL